MEAYVSLLYVVNNSAGDLTRANHDHRAQSTELSFSGCQEYFLLGLLLIQVLLVLMLYNRQTREITPRESIERGESHSLLLVEPRR
jgi:hypothetical protein